VSDRTVDPLAGLSTDLAAMLTDAPVQDKVLAELAVSWPSLGGPEAGIAEALRLFLLTWDPLDLRAPRPVASATANAGPPSLEIVVYVPLWWVMEAASQRGATVAVVLGELVGSAVVVAAGNEEAVLSGRYPVLVRKGSVPHLLGEPGAGFELGPPQLSLVSEGWHPVGLGAITDMVQDALGPVDLDRSPVELAAVDGPMPGCPACRGRRFAFPGELGERAPSMFAPHRVESDRATTERYGRAGASNSEGWAAITYVCARLELPHVPNGLAAQLAGAEDAMFELPEPEELAAEARAVIEAAGWFPGRPVDFALALGAEDDESLAAGVAEEPGARPGPCRLRRRGGGSGRGVEPGGPPPRVRRRRRRGCGPGHCRGHGRGSDPDRGEPQALARRPVGPGPRRRRPADLGDTQGAEAHFLAALDLAEEADGFEARSDIVERLDNLGRPLGARTRIRLVDTDEQSGAASRPRPGRNDPCFCGSGCKYKSCHGQRT
jgi:hypothetical protein